MLGPQVLAASWGSAYGDPPGFCPAHSFLPQSYQVLVTSDPSVASNPEQSTFWGIHPYPGYDNWYGFWYGDYAGHPGDQSGWIKIGTSYYGQPPLHWNFADYGWQVHGHVKQYIAYYNWTFGGQCRMGWPGRPDPAPYMADVYGFPVLDIYVDSTPPEPPQPRVSAVGAHSLSFTWDAVQDRGDGSGADYWASGMDHYDSWITLGNGPVQDLRSSSEPRTLSVSGLAAWQQACVHVVAVDRLGNRTADQTRCAEPFGEPPAPPAPASIGLLVAPRGSGLTGLQSWFWLDHAAPTQSSSFNFNGYSFRYTFTPTAVDWSFGDGAFTAMPLPAGAGLPWPQRSTITHTYQAVSRSGYQVVASVQYSATWQVWANGQWLGPYPAAGATVPSPHLVYPVQEATSELSGIS